MSLKVKHDGSGPKDTMENCCMCYTKTRFWYTPKDVALCKICAATAEIEQIPDKVDWCNAVRDKFYPNEKPLNFEG